MLAADAALIRWDLPFGVIASLDCAVATGQDHVNPKGLISDQGQHEEAFYFFQKACKSKMIGSATATT